ncbi:NPCBM-associated, NEW3 domain of alpha-galactosidase [Filimonas lacunae]|uniref:NPCBM-associated, NEW3 domain of alpha-galactosidase n=1 Tax=Filimonas lacunae TaxID=477680 RepID=A0A173MFP8_9BACT|nr:NEW3 domain-containing protein [Filimonas lacunae]BAV06309.1 S-layer domain protein [Filimonas lacunae]SIT25747.1 NPCBM-associated, NEW3 domain of alpha-galactosidase [Filimonas lacunae]
MFTKSLITRLRNPRYVIVFALTALSLFQYRLLFAQTAPTSGPSSFTARLINIEAATSEVFRYTTTLRNGSGKAGIYDLQTALPAGWLITYRVEGSQVTSVNMEAGKSQDISIEINAPAGTKPDKYKIPVKAVSANESLLLTLEAVVKGTYSLELTTPTGRLTDEVTSGSRKEIHLVVKNSGSLPLKDIEFSSQLPTNWECTFEPAKVQQLDAGKTADIIAKVQVPDKTIAGDYAATFTTRNTNSNAQAVFRMVVNTSLLSGWIGVLVILIAAGLVYYLVRKYGRR